MRYYSILIPVLLLFAGNWETDLQEAEQKAVKEHKLILLNFSGSDWCIPCIRMHKDVFDSQKFSEYAEGNLVLLNADFPRLKKNKLSKEQAKRNEALAEKYNPSGAFPLTLLLDPDGHVLQKWEGDPGLNPEQFISQIKQTRDAIK